jgi:HPt (histidine-containing phosphotransfer) domain-containing protein
MSAYYDAARVEALQDAMQSDARSIIGSMLATMTTAIEEVEATVASGQLDQATQAAHACRNDALMLGATQLLEALTELEAATRDQHEERTLAALGRVREVWPPTRDELAAAAGANPP